MAAGSLSAIVSRKVHAGRLRYFFLGSLRLPYVRPSLPPVARSRREARLTVSLINAVFSKRELSVAPLLADEQRVVVNRIEIKSCGLRLSFFFKEKH